MFEQHRVLPEGHLKATVAWEIAKMVKHYLHYEMILHRLFKKITCKIKKFPTKKKLNQKFFFLLAGTEIICQKSL